MFKELFEKTKVRNDDLLNVLVNLAEDSGGLEEIEKTIGGYDLHFTDVKSAKKARAVLHKFITKEQKIIPAHKWTEEMGWPTFLLDDEILEIKAYI